MRHIQLDKLLEDVFSDPDKKHKDRLLKAHKQAARRKGTKRQLYIDTRGPDKWSPVKTRLTAILGNKCWYTEVELIGASLAIDHYRPTCDYWFLSFTPANFRVSCPFANSPKHNPLYNCVGGKGDRFPLLPPTQRATRTYLLSSERPVILDPCNPADCALIAFQTTGRPVIHPDYVGDPTAVYRVEESNILLNLDHPDFNSKREELYHDILDDVETYEDLAPKSKKRETIRGRMKRRLSEKAPFSIAARQYLKLYRGYDWVEDLLERK